MRFGTGNVKNFSRVGLLKSVARKLAKYMFSVSTGQMGQGWHSTSRRLYTSYVSKKVLRRITRPKRQEVRGG
jgi:hypothetical protein